MGDFIREELNKTINKFNKLGDEIRDDKDTEIITQLEILNKKLKLEESDLLIIENLNKEIDSKLNKNKYLLLKTIIITMMFVFVSIFFMGNASEIFLFKPEKAKYLMPIGIIVIIISGLIWLKKKKKEISFEIIVGITIGFISSIIIFNIYCYLAVFILVKILEILWTGFIKWISHQ